MSDLYLVEELSKEWSQSEWYKVNFVSRAADTVRINFFNPSKKVLTISDIVCLDIQGHNTEYPYIGVRPVFCNESKVEEFHIPNNGAALRFYVTNNSEKERHEIIVSFDGSVTAHRIV